MSKIFGTENAKTKKGEALGYTTLICYMAPARQNSKGKNICPNATPGCLAACLYTAGRGAFTSVQRARISKTDRFLANPLQFLEDAAKEIRAAVKKHGASAVCVRLNGTSDIPWENLKLDSGLNLMETFPGIQFYDYTKSFSRLTSKLPANYHLTYSMAETERSREEARKALELGFNIAVVFHSPSGLPGEFMGAVVVDGDQHDLTFIHGNGVVLGLKAKGAAKKDTTGFVIRC